MGLSRGVTVHCGTSFANERQVKSGARRGGSPKPLKFKLNKSRKELLEARRVRNERMASPCILPLPVLYADQPPHAVLSFQERQDLLDMNENDIEMDLDDSWEDVDDADVMLSVPPPGEEGFFLSHAGGESTLQQIFVESMSKRYELLSLETSELH